MSYIQKTIYALFLLALFSGCTDEVIDGGGGTNVPMIEDGTLVNVGIALDGSMAKTVVTRSMDDDDEPEVDDDLVILQYKGENLVHAWYTDREFDDGHGDYKELEGWGQQTPVKNIKLLSGSGYKVFVIANLNLDENDEDGDDDGDDVGSYYSPIIITDGNDTYKGEKIDDERGSILLTGNYNEKFKEHFGTLNNLRNWQLSILDKSSTPDDDDVMLAVVSNGAMGAPNKVYRYTKMLTNVSDATNINDVIAEAPDVKITGNTSDDRLCATLYQPYAMISLKIVGSDNLNATVNIESVKIKNCPTDYTLVNGYKLNGYGVDAFFSKKDDGDDDYDTYDSRKDAFAGETIKKGETIIPKSKKDNVCVFVYENMAGSLADKTNPNGNGSKDAVSNYTYIEVVGKINSKPITYRFILGKDRDYDCNVERNVHYNVTMTLTGDGGVNNATWEVIYEGAKPDDKPVVDGGYVLSRLDAHASVKEFTIRNMKKDTYFYVVVNKNPESSHIDINANNTDLVEAKGEYTYNSYAGGFNALLSSNDQIALYKKRDSEFYKVKISKDGNYTFKYRQLSWFDYSRIKKNMPTGEAKKYNITEPSTVATATPNTYYLHIYEGNKSNIGNNVATLTVTQYPPVVVTKQTGASEKDGFSKYTFISSSSYAYMERFDDDHSTLSQGNDWKNDEQLGSGWTIIDDNTKEYEDYMFDYNNHPIFRDYMKSDYCYWVNLHGPYTSIRTIDTKWPFEVRSLKDTKRYIIPWSN